MNIQPVVTRPDLKRFVTFPWRIYRDDPNWVPPIIAGQMDKLTPGRNPFWEHAERALWLATDAGKPVGTIAAIIDHAGNRTLGQTVGSFGFFECVNDKAVACLLLTAAADWLAAHGMTVMCGPYNPSGNDEPGLLVEGHDTRPALMEGHTPPYYVDLVEAAGFRKQWDTVAWLSVFPPEARRVEDVIPPKLLRTAKWAASRSQARLRPVDLSRWEAEVAIACQIYNAALAHLPNQVPFPEAEFQHMAASFKPLVDPALAFYAEVNGEPVAFALTLPDLNEALQHVNGRLGTIGMAKLWWYSRHLRRATFKILMIRPEFRGRGLESLLTTETARAIFARGFREVDMSLTGEDNENMQRIMAGLGMQVYRRYRVYERTIDDRRTTKDKAAPSDSIRNTQYAIRNTHHEPPMTTTPPTTTRLPRRTKIIFGLGDWGPTTAGTAIMFFFAFFLTDVAGLPPAYASIVLLIGGLWDAINDPIVGLLADRVHTRWGRRRPFFLFGAAPFALSLIALWWVPPWDAPLAKMLYYAVAFVVWDTVFTLVSVPYSALTPELTEDYDERSRLNGYRMVVSMAGGLIAAVSVPYVAGLFPQPQTGYLLMAAIFGVLGAVPYLLLFFGIRERFAGRPLSEASFGPRQWGETLVSVLRNRPFRYAVGIFLTSWVTVNLVASLFQYYLTYPMQMPGEVEVVLGLLQASALIFTAVAVLLATRWGKQQTYVVGAVWLMVIVLTLTFLLPNAQTVIFALALLAGFGVAIVQVTPWSMVPDVMEVDELATGQRREATHYGILTFAQKGGTALALALMQAVLALTGYVAGAQQTPGVLLAIRLMMGPVPAVLLAISAWLALRYPLTRERYAEVRAQLAERRKVAGDME